jgi:hypothetical protein
MAYPALSGLQLAKFRFIQSLKTAISVFRRAVFNGSSSTDAFRGLLVWRTWTLITYLKKNIHFAGFPRGMN